MRSISLRPLADQLDFFQVYKYAYSLPNAVEPDVNPWSAVPEYMVDPDKACVQGWGPAARKGT